jgi:hypothetical protein
MMEEITITHKSGTLQDQSLHIWLVRGNYQDGWSADTARNRVVVLDAHDFSPKEGSLHPLNVIWK